MPTSNSGFPRPKSPGSLLSRKQFAFAPRAKAWGFLRRIKKSSANIDHRSDLRQSVPYLNWMKFLGWEIILVGKNYAFVRKIPLLGSVIKIQRPVEPIAFQEVAKIANQHHALFVKIEPQISQNEPSLVFRLKSHHYVAGKWALISTKTLLVSLEASETAIFNQFKKDCRSEIKKALNLHPSIEKNNFENFYKTLRQSNKTKGLWTLPKSHYDALIKSFGNKVFCINELISESQDPVAGCLVLIAGKTAYYFLAGSLPEGKQVHAPYLVVWESIKEARKTGCTLWDFEGIKDDRIPSTRSWKGFSHFKKSFGGYEITFPGSFNWYRNPIFKILSPFMN